MQLQAYGPTVRAICRSVSTVWLHRARIVVGALLILLAFGLAVFAPFLFALAIVERRNRGQRRLLFTLAVIGAVAWLWRELTRNPHEPHGPWHPCRQCGYPIANTSRARYCSSGCRRIARLTERATNGDERAIWRLAALNRKDGYDPATGEIPF